MVETVSSVRAVLTKEERRGLLKTTPGNLLFLRVCVIHRHMNFTAATMANQATEAAKGKNKPHFDNFRTYFGTFPSPLLFFACDKQEAEKALTAQVAVCRLVKPPLQTRGGGHV